jgi:hypothetical protein
MVEDVDCVAETGDLGGEKRVEVPREVEGWCDQHNGKILLAIGRRGDIFGTGGLTGVG